MNISEPHFSVWIILGGVVAVALAVDLGVLHRKPRTIGFREAMLESLGWIVLSLGFNFWVYVTQGAQKGLEFLAGYLVEKSLSIDNIFVFLVIFQSLNVPSRSQHKVLYYGVGGAVILRGLFIYAGVELLQEFHAVLYIFGAILLLTALRMLLPGTRLIDPETNWLVRATKKIFPIAENTSEHRFLVKRGGKRYATQLFLALMAVEAMDIVFAVDSVPAVLAITRDAFVVYSSNVFAILGLRALYFALANVLPRFRFLHQGLAAILIFVGLKMLASDRIAIGPAASLGVLAGILVVTIAASAFFPRRSTPKDA